MVTYEERTRGGRNICTMRHVGSAAMDIVPRELTWGAEKKPMIRLAVLPRLFDRRSRHLAVLPRGYLPSIFGPRARFAVSPWIFLRGA